MVRVGVPCIFIRRDYGRLAYNSAMNPTPAALLAQALNALLARQPNARSRLLRHTGKRLVLALPFQPLDLTVDDAGRFALPGPETEADEMAGALATLTLTPNPAALPRWLTGGKLSELFHAEGDGLFAADIAHAVADFDWVLALRPYLGDLAASRVDQALQGFTAWRGQAADNLGRNVAEYAVHEAAVLADPLAVKTFITDVDRLREDVDRLEARLKLLESESVPK